MPDQTSQAPVAGADPRAWREMAGKLEAACVGDLPAYRHEAAAALRAAAEAGTERDGRVGWLASLVIERLGGTPDVPAWVAQSAENYRRLTRERDDAITALRADAARGAEGERGAGVVADLNEQIAEMRREIDRLGASLREHHRIGDALDDYADARDCAACSPTGTLVPRLGLAGAPRPSAGPAAGAVCGVADPVARLNGVPVRCERPAGHAGDHEMAGNAGSYRWGAARASDDPALVEKLRTAMRAIGPHYHLVDAAAHKAKKAGRQDTAERLDYVYGRLYWMDHALGTMRERVSGEGDAPAAAPAAPEVPRGE